MFKSRKHSSHTVSPLAPPPLSPASTDVSSFRQQQQNPFDQAQASHQQQHQQPSQSQFQPNTNMNSQSQSQSHTYGQGQAAGLTNHSFAPVERITSQGGASTKEKRRSGFFGLGGKKDKDKDKDKDKHQDREKEEARSRQSFSVERPSTLHRPSQGSVSSGSQVPNGHGSAFANGSNNDRPQSEGNFQFQSMRQYPPPQQGLPSPQQPQPPFQQQQQQRAVSSPGAPPTTLSSESGSGLNSPNEFDPSQSGVPKSQSMGFNRPSQVPDTHPYRGYMNAQQEKERQNIPRSSSMPLDQHTPPPPPKTNGSDSGASPRSQQDGLPQRSPQAATQSSGGVLRAFDRVVELIGYQPQKTYVTSPPELEMILARTSAGGQPKQGQPGTPANDWDAVWLQLSGISLSMWSMKETRIAAAKGDKVPPTYFNITDSSLELLAPLPPPPHRPNSHPHSYVFSLNTAGSNRLLFSCPSERDLAKWAIGLRLAAWERSRLEEIYTGHLIQSGGREPKSDLVKGRLEGWVRVRVMGGTEWKRLWVVLSLPGHDESGKEEEKKGRRRSFFGMGDKEKEPPVQEPNTGVAMASFYNEPRTAKNRTSVVPVLTMTNVTQTYAVFPERLEVMSQSNLLKVVGRVSGDMVTIEGRLRDSGWALLMPETPGEGAPGEKEKSHHHSSGVNQTPLSNMMKWVTGFHDVFGLYGRPEKYNWDPRNSKSLLFAYPKGDDRHLFLSIDEALMSDFRTPHLAAVRAGFVNLIQRKLEGKLRLTNESIDEGSEGDEEEERGQAQAQTQSHTRPQGDYRLPPLAFGDAPPNVSDHSVPRSLTPITERTDITSRADSTRTAKSQFTAVGIGAPGSGSAAGGAGDRKTSGGSSKQGSQSSSKQGNSGLGGEERLAPIADTSTEGFGHFTEEPVDAQVVQDTPTTAESKTAPTIWSQDTGGTPTPHSGGPSPLSPQDFPQPFGSLTPTPRAQPSQQQQQAAQSVVPRRHEREEDFSSAPSNTATSPAPPILAGPVKSPVEREVLAPTPRRASSGGERRRASGDLHDEPAALYLMNMVEENPSHTQRLSPANASATTIKKSPSPERTRPTINTDLDPVTKQARPEFGRKPSGARAPPPRRNSGSRVLDTVADAVTAEPDEMLAKDLQQQQQHSRIPTSSTQADLGEDISTFIDYADNPSPIKSKAAPIPTQATSPPSKPRDEVRSSFAPSKAAAERRAKAEQQERDKHMPGGGRRRGVAAVESSGSESSDDDEETSPQLGKRQLHGLPVPPSATSSAGPARKHQSDPPVQRATSTTRALPPVPIPTLPEVREPNGNSYPQDRGSVYSSRQPSFDQPRPRSRSPAAPAPMSMYSSGPPPLGGPAPRAVSQPAPPPPAIRQTLWNANFSADHGMRPENRSGKFVEIDEPAAQLTKAFAPHGLLQAGMQDKEDRSAKKQEEVARETGSSLINVPAKPPPPAAGLLGAVAAHEKERKNAGGIGATLTDRERDKRLAEDRQRDNEKLQRQQMEHMRQFGGDPYAQQQGYNPYNMPGMGMGMNIPMMGMPQMGYPPYGGGGYNPYAQQQAMMAAQMAYQQAMMMSAAGSQAGDHYDQQQPGSVHQTPGGYGPANGRSGSPAGSTRSQNYSPPPMPQFYGGGAGANGPGSGYFSTPPMMGSPMGMGMPMSSPWGMIPQPPMWGPPSPAPGSVHGGQGSPMGQQRFDWLSPGQSGLSQGQAQGQSQGQGQGSEGGDRRSRVSSFVAAEDGEAGRRGYGAS